MKISVLQHAEYEGPGEIAAWAESRGHSVDVHHLYRGAGLPSPRDFDFLVVMGGEMNIYQYRDWPWLREESAFITAALANGKRIVGVCLGAQLLADALGSRVVQNAEYELGWFPVQWTGDAAQVFPGLPESSTVLHWHGDTFGLPTGATRLAASPGCPEQGFVIANKCLALQFHMEVDPQLVERYVASQGEWPKGRFVQTPKGILGEGAPHCGKNRALLHAMLDGFCA